MLKNTVSAAGEAMPTIPALYADWQRQMSVASVAPEDTADDEINTAATIEARMNDLQPVTAADFAMKLLVVTGNGDFQPTPELIGEAQALAARPGDLNETVSRLSMQIAEMLDTRPALSIDLITISARGVYTAIALPGMKAKPSRTGNGDPVLSAIEAFRDGMAAFNGMLTTTDDDADAAIEATYGPPQQVIQSWNEPARTYSGAVEAVRLALDEAQQFMSADTIAPMLKAALAYFDSHNQDAWEVRT